MALFGITRYPFSGKARSCIAPGDAPKRFSLCQMITNARTKCSRTQVRVRHLLRPEGQTNPLAIRFWRTAGFEPAIIELDRLKGQAFFGIHFGISSCTAVKDRLKHRLEVTCKHILPSLPAFFTEKKLRKQQKSPQMRAFCYFNPQFNCFFSFSMNNFLKDSEPRTSTIGPKERTLITSSDSSSWAYLIFTR